MKFNVKLNLIIFWFLVFSQNVFSQTAPNISYSTPNTFIVGTSIIPLSPINTGGAAAINGQTSTFAGSGTVGGADGTGTSATFTWPIGVAIDAQGNTYVADGGDHLIRKITPAGVVTTIAGNGSAGYANGTGTAASFNHPMAIAIDGSGNLYVADEYNNAIRKITPAGVVSTFAGSATGVAGSADGQGTAATFNYPISLTFDSAGNLYVADYAWSYIRKISPSGIVSKLAGAGSAGYQDGIGSAAKFYNPTWVATDASGNVYVADRSNNRIREVTSAGVVTTVAGSGSAGFTNGTGTTATFNFPSALVLDGSGNIYVTDEYNNAIRKITPAGVVTTLSGTGTVGANNGIGPSATFNNPFGITIDQSGTLIVGDYVNHLVRKVVTRAFIANPALPAGLILDPLSGTISGAPTTASSAISYSITAYNAYGSSTASLSITVNPSQVTTSSNINYVAAFAPRVSGITTSAGLSTSSGDKAQVETTVQYFDGLGRPLETVQFQGSAMGRDLIQPFAYDQLGRDSVSYLPYTVASLSPGSYQNGALSGTGGYTGGGQYQFYQQSGQGYANITYPNAGTNYEPSPLNRVIEKGAPGASWQLSTSGVSGSGHTMKMVYGLNNSTSFSADSVNGMQVANYSCTINGDNSRTLNSNGYYAAGTLAVTVAKDENWVSGRAGTVEEYKDMNGRVVLKRQYNYTTSVQMLSTYYVYDDFGMLAFVLTPASGADVAGTISQTTLDNLCYQYQYDARHRPIEKKIPGKGWEFTVYNAIDQPVATQDAIQRANNQWAFAKYDAVGRPVITGTWNNNNTAISQASLQSNLAGIVANLHEVPVSSGNGYSNVAWPTTYVTSTLTINFYDTYTGIPGLPATYTISSGVSVMTRGLPTVKKTAVLNTPTDQLWDVIYYDDLGRTTMTYSQHYLGGTANLNNYDQITTTYNFTNQPTTVTRKHWNTASTNYPLVTVANTYLYDHMGRKLKTWEQITNGNSAPTTKTLISKIDYNEIGQVLTKHLHSTDSVNFYQNISYTYNERGWLLGSSAPLFAMQLYYNTGTYPQYNGNIGNQYYGTPGNLNKYFTYAYDKLNRMTSGWNTDLNKEAGISYDVMGNITALQRYTTGNTLIDNLTYTYTGNQLQSVVDASGSNTGLVNGTTTYGYDGNGNMLSNTNTVNTTQNKSFSYNLLNLPQAATLSNGTVTYTYDAGGNKLRKVAVINSVTTTTEYIAGIQYNNSTTAVDFIQTEEGKAVPNGTGYDYSYYLGDNLGNTRVTFDTQTGIAVQLQRDDYYAFGMEINSVVNSPKNEYLYNKKELQEEFTEYDYGARFYDPTIARWNTIDPLAEKSRRWSPYNYVLNNPIRLVDPDGMQDVDINGPEQQKATEELQKSVQGQLNLTRDDQTGKISYTTVDGVTPNADAQQLMKAIDDHSVDVHVNATDNTKDMIGGAFRGNSVTPSANEDPPTVQANQEVNPNMTSTIDTYYDKPGANTLHEVTEAYQGAKISQASGVSSPEAGQTGSVKDAAHVLATPQAGGEKAIIRVVYDNQGNPLKAPYAGAAGELYYLKSATKPALVIQNDKVNQN
jgi:RHS repeat-associated protein